MAASQGDVEAFAGRMLEAALGFTDVATVYIGERLGLYRALAASGPATAKELAAGTQTHERYVREWLEQQAVTGILAVDDVEAAPDERRYSLPPAQAEVLTDADSLAYLPWLSRLFVSTAGALPGILEAFQTGGGVSWGRFGEDARVAQAAQNRVPFLSLIGTEWFPAVADVHARLQADPPARVADVACGAGFSSIGFARAYPKVLVDGFDLDAPSIEMATRNAEEMGVSDRVRFFVRDAADPALEGRYDLVTIFEALHDLSQPVAALKAMRGMLADGGTAVVVDEKVADRFTAPGDDAERLFYGFSVLCCLPAGMADQPSEATGTMMRIDILRRYAREAGFTDVEVLPVEHDMFRFYRLLG